MSALLALLRRDLLGGGRRGARLWGRAVALLLSGLVVLGFLFNWEQVGDDAPSLAPVLFWLLLLFATAFAPAVALLAFQAERDAGTLDLLLLAGLSPTTLAAARTLSTFLFFLSLLAATLPALALAWFFRSPTPLDLLACFLAGASYLLLLSALAIAISAWGRGTGPTLAASFVAIPLLAIPLVLPGEPQAWSPIDALERLSSGEPTPAVLRDLGLASLWHVAAALALVLLASRGLARITAGRPSDELARRVDRKGPRLSSRRPLTWLLQRSSAAASPRTQLLAVPVLGVLVGIGLLVAWPLGGRPSDLLDAPVLSVAGGLLGLGAAGAALATAATRIASERERRTWDSLLSTTRSDESILLDLIGGTLSAAALPFLAACTLLAGAELQRGRTPREVGMALGALLATLLLATALGLAASACASTGAAALGLAGGLLVGLPTLVAATGLLFGLRVLPDPGDLMLIFFLLFLGLPILLRGLGWVVLLAASSLRENLRRKRGPGMLIAWPAAVLGLTVLFSGGLGSDLDDKVTIAYGGLGTLTLHVLSFGEDRAHLDTSLVYQGALWQLLYALLDPRPVIWQRRAVWLGRTA